MLVVAVGPVREGWVKAARQGWSIPWRAVAWSCCPLDPPPPPCSLTRRVLFSRFPFRQPHVNPTIPTWGTDDDGRAPYTLNNATLKGSGCKFRPACPRCAAPGEAAAARACAPSGQTYGHRVCRARVLACWRQCQHARARARAERLARTHAHGS